MTEADAIHECLRGLIRTPDYDELQDACDEIERRADRLEFVPDLLAIMEAHPDFDFGTPGPVVHTMEKCAGYTKYLIDSIERMPMFYTIWMVNRLANGTSGRERMMYIDLLRQVSSNEKWDLETRDSAKELLIHQESFE